MTRPPAEARGPRGPESRVDTSPTPPELQEGPTRDTRPSDLWPPDRERIKLICVKPRAWAWLPRPREPPGTRVTPTLSSASVGSARGPPGSSSRLSASCTYLQGAPRRLATQAECHLCPVPPLRSLLLSLRAGAPVGWEVASGLFPRGSRSSRPLAQSVARRSHRGPVVAPGPPPQREPRHHKASSAEGRKLRGRCSGLRTPGSLAFGRSQALRYCNLDFRPT